VGFLATEVAPSPKFQRYVGAGVPVELFVKLTTPPAMGWDGAKVKLTDGGAVRETTTLCVEELEPFVFCSVRVTL